jgi:flavin reductase (DIM6/NTAB) family NADH-FMN oxidoreductase RutF
LSTAFTQRELRDAFGLFATGVTVVTAVRPDGAPVGVTANSFSSVSLEPPLLLWCLASGSGAAAAFTHGAAFAVHILAHHQLDMALNFARRTHDKFEMDRHQWRNRPQPPQLADALCRFDCRVHAVHAGGDHLIVVGEVHGIAGAPGTPLAFHAGRFGNFSADRGVPKVDIWEGLEDHWY